MVNKVKKLKRVLFSLTVRSNVPSLERAYEALGITLATNGEPRLTPYPGKKSLRDFLVFRESYASCNAKLKQAHLGLMKSAVWSSGTSRFSYGASTFMSTCLTHRTPERSFVKQVIISKGNRNNMHLHVKSNIQELLVRRAYWISIIFGVLNITIDSIESNVSLSCAIKQIYIMYVMENCAI